MGTYIAGIFGRKLGMGLREEIIGVVELVQVLGVCGSEIYGAGGL